MTEAIDARQFESAAVDAVSAALPQVDLDALRASFDLIRASTRLVQRLEADVHREAGWSMAGFRVMFCVWVGGELEPRDIARLSGLSRRPCRVCSTHSSATGSSSAAASRTTAGS